MVQDDKGIENHMLDQNDIMCLDSPVIYIRQCSVRLLTRFPQENDFRCIQDNHLKHIGWQSHESTSSFQFL